MFWNIDLHLRVSQGKPTGSERFTTGSERFTTGSERFTTGSERFNCIENILYDPVLFEDYENEQKYTVMTRYYVSLLRQGIAKKSADLSEIAFYMLMNHDESLALAVFLNSILEHLVYYEVSDDKHVSIESIVFLLFIKRFRRLMGLPDRLADNIYERLAYTVRCAANTEVSEIHSDKSSNNEIILELLEKIEKIKSSTPINKIVRIFRKSLTEYLAKHGNERVTLSSDNREKPRDDLSKNDIMLYSIDHTVYRGLPGLLRWVDKSSKNSQDKPRGYYKEYIKSISSSNVRIDKIEKDNLHDILRELQSIIFSVLQKTRQVDNINILPKLTEKCPISSDLPEIQGIPLDILYNRNITSIIRIDDMNRMDILKSLINQINPDSQDFMKIKRSVLESLNDKSKLVVLGNPSIHDIPVLIEKQYKADIHSKFLICTDKPNLLYEQLYSRKFDGLSVYTGEYNRSRIVITNTVDSYLMSQRWDLSIVPYGTQMLRTKSCILTTDQLDCSVLTSSSVPRSKFSQSSNHLKSLSSSNKFSIKRSYQDQRDDDRKIITHLIDNILPLYRHRYTVLFLRDQEELEIYKELSQNRSVKKRKTENIPYVYPIKTIQDASLDSLDIQEVSNNLLEVKVWSIESLNDIDKYDVVVSRPNLTIKHRHIHFFYLSDTYEEMLIDWTGRRPTYNDIARYEEELHK